MRWRCRDVSARISLSASSMGGVGVAAIGCGGGAEGCDAIDGVYSGMGSAGGTLPLLAAASGGAHLRETKGC